MIGRYIDALAKAGEWDALDRVIVADNWTTCVTISESGNRCLIGHVEDYLLTRGMVSRGAPHCRTYAGGVTPYGVGIGVGHVFDALCSRFGLERVVRAIKMRAGKHTRVTLPAPTERAVSC